ncbi:interactor of constitutive active ROPs 3-like [Nicotiana tomentosiformis]|uniref:interactor of constitutive active ROPs 3-like n=1 Tax=Nicotiana tomentosiformis TaxID=4098 RepID=UPI00388CE732
MEDRNPPLIFCEQDRLLSAHRGSYTPFPKTVELRPPVGDEDLPADSSTSGQPGAIAGEKKRKRAPSSPSSEKKKPRRRLVRKPKKRSSSRVHFSDSLFRLRDEPEEDELFMAHESSIPEEWMATEGETTEANPPQVHEAGAEVRAKIFRDTGSALPGVIDILGSPSFTESMFDEAGATKERSNEGVHGADDPLRCFFDGVDSTTIEDFTELGNLEVPRKSPSSEASVLHHETFLRYRDVLSQPEADVKELVEKRDMYKLLNEHREGEGKNLRVELDATQKEHANLVEYLKIFEVSDDELDMVSNGQNPQVQQKVDRVDQLRAEMDEVKAMVEESMGKLDRLALEKETAQEQLASAEAQLRVAREKAEARSQKIKDLQSQLGSAAAERDTLAQKLKAAKSVVEITRSNAKEIVAQYKANAEAAQDRLKVITE